MDMELYFSGGRRVFPDKWRDAVVNALSLHAVKKRLHKPPSFEIATVAG